MNYIDKVDKLELIELQNKRDTRLKILNFGATIFSLTLESVNVIVGPKNPKDYLTEIYHIRGKFFGATVGRHAGRISQSGFNLNGRKYPLFEKQGIHIHGGEYGLSYRFWSIVEKGEGKDPFVVLEYLSPDGEEGYPGNLRVRVKYTLTEDNELRIEYSAKTDKETVVNLTNHAYFNLNGAGDIDDHKLKIPAGEFLEVDGRTVPTGKLLKTSGTQYDFRKLTSIGEVPLDTAFSFQKGGNEILLKGDKSGITLQVQTNQPAVVVYVPDELPTDWEYSTDVSAERAGICLETQKFPDAVHQSHFQSIILKPGEEYKNLTSWKFISGS